MCIRAAQVSITVEEAGMGKEHRFSEIQAASFFPTYLKYVLKNCMEKCDIFDRMYTMLYPHKDTILQTVSLGFMCLKSPQNLQGVRGLGASA